MNKIRGFEVVSDAHRAHFKDLNMYGQHKRVHPPITLPVRADERSAGYDFSCPVDMDLLPAQKTIVWLDVKAYMQPDEVLHVYPRSSMGIKKGLMLANTVGIIDSSYYNNPGNDGNIGLALLNTSGVTIKLKQGDRIAQGLFSKFLASDNGNEFLTQERVGGMGSTGE